MVKFSRRRLLAAAAGLSWGCRGAEVATEAPATESLAAEPPEGPELLATYYPTPLPVVRLMLEMSGLRPGDLLYDLGSGDGRIVLMAAREFGAHAVGYEIDELLIAESRSAIKAADVEDRAEIRNEDLILADYSAPDVISTFLTPEGLAKVTPRLEQTLRPGTRLVAYKFPLPGWTPERVEELVDEDPEIPLHEVFLYRWG
ncbi:MAG: SAM-dependent methyltransferase [Acidobacteria bacterium]|nr:SAM-dependent methyltransferase [Acidobacteriota bacterium]